MKKRTLALMLGVVMALSLTACGGDSEEVQNPTPPDFVVTDFDRAVWDVVVAQDASLEALSHEEAEIYVTVNCDNDEDEVNAIIAGISEVVQANEVENPVCVVAKEEGESSNLVIADIATDGSVDFVYTSPNYEGEPKL